MVQVDLQQKKWSRREEANFLRTILAYGVEYNKAEQRYNWDRSPACHNLSLKEQSHEIFYSLFFFFFKQLLLGPIGMSLGRSKFYQFFAIIHILVDQ